MKNGGWANKIEICSICKELFIVRKNAKTNDTRTLCVKCRRAVRETIEELKK